MKRLLFWRSNGWKDFVGRLKCFLRRHDWQMSFGFGCGEEGFTQYRCGRPGCQARAISDQPPPFFPLD